MLAPEPDIEVAGEAGSGDEAVALARGGNFDVILMDLRMPGTDGVDAIGRLVAGDPEARIVVLTTYETDADIHPGGGGGRRGLPAYRTRREAEVANAIRAAARGRRTPCWPLPWRRAWSPGSAARSRTRCPRARWRCCNWWRAA